MTKSPYKPLNFDLTGIWVALFTGMQKSAKALKITVIALLAGLILLVASPSPAQSLEASEQTRRQMYLTHTLYKLVLKYHFAQHVEKYDPIHSAQRAYYITFLNEWARLIDLGQHTKSQQIFETIQKRNSYLGKHYHIWEALINPRLGFAERMRFDYTVGAAFFVFLRSETESSTLLEQVEKILEDTLSVILVNGRNKELAWMVASNFENSEHKEVSDKVEEIKKNLGVPAAVGIATMARDFVLGLGMFKALFNANTVRNTVSATAATAPASAPSWVATAGSSGRWNPFIKESQRIYYSLGVSAAANAGAMSLMCSGSGCFSAEQGQGKSEPSKVSLEMSLASLWSSTDKAFGSTPALEALHTVVDFRIDHEVLTKEQLIRKLVQLIETGSSEPYHPLMLILQAEKILGLDGRAPQDMLAYDFAYGRIKSLGRTLNESLEEAKRKSPALEDIEKLRAIIIDGVLSIYRGNQTSALSVLLGWGGNCQSRTTIMIGLLDGLRGFPDQELNVLSYPDHVEAALSMPENKQLMLVDGAIIQNPERVINKNAVYAIYLRLLGHVSARQAKVGVYANLQLDVREVTGVITKTPYSLLKNNMSSQYGQGDIPEVAVSRFRPAGHRGGPGGAFGASSLDAYNVNNIPIFYVPESKSSQLVHTGSFKTTCSHYTVQTEGSTWPDTIERCEKIETNSFDIYMLLQKEKQRGQILKAGSQLAEILNKKMSTMMTTILAEARSGKPLSDLLRGIDRNKERIDLIGSVRDAQEFFSNKEDFEDLYYPYIRMLWQAISSRLEQKPQEVIDFVSYAKNEVYSDFFTNSEFIHYLPDWYGLTLWEASLAMRKMSGAKKLESSALRARRAATVVKSWLAQLSKEMVSLSDGCVTPQIQLPKASRQENRDFNGGVDSRMQVSLITVENCSQIGKRQSGSSGGATYEITHEQLIHLALIFGEGFQLWTSETVDALLKMTKMLNGDSQFEQLLRARMVLIYIAPIKIKLQEKYGSSIPTVFQPLFNVSIPRNDVVSDEERSSIKRIEITN